MTVIHEEILPGYLEDEYLETPYLATDVLGHMGHQCTFVVAAALGMQYSVQVSDETTPFGAQAHQQIVDHVTAYGAQANLQVDGAEVRGMQANFRIADQLLALAQQALFEIVDARRSVAEQARFFIDSAAARGLQTKFVLSKQAIYGQQAQYVINRRRVFGQQAEFSIVDRVRARGMQADFVNVTSYGQQCTIALYNTKLLRILIDFPSRGLAGATGMNEWGFPAGQGQSWKSNSTADGDFLPANLNTDVTEQKWRSASLTGINLDCDTERNQGVFLDTLAILDHNLTTSANVTLLGSNDPTFGVIGITIPLSPRLDDPNTYWLAPELPNVGYRFWRLAIDDPQNPDGFCEIGAIIFGGAEIFQGEAFVDEVEFQLKDFTDSVPTEGFTNVNNSRAQKKLLRLEFRSLRYTMGNYRIMRRLFRQERTVLKCLWLPTPDKDNEEYTARFAIFSKLSAIPSERHNHKGGRADYVSFTIELDESK